MSKNKKQNKLSISLLFIGLFCWLFTNGGILLWSIGLFLFTIFMIIEKIPLRKSAINESILFFFLLMVSLLRFEIFLRTDVSSYQSDAIIGNTAKYVLLIGVWLTLRSLVLDKKGMILKKALKPLLLVNVIFFYIQFIVMVINNYYIDAAKFFIGEESRYSGIIYDSNAFGSFRATGFYVEPSNYFFTVLVLAILLILVFGFKNCKGLIILTIVSIFLTFSTAAWFIGILFVIYILYSEKVSSKFYVITLLVVLPIAILGAVSINNVYERQIQRAEGSSGEMRFALLKEVYNRDLAHSITNYGLFAIDKKLLGLTQNFGRGDRELGSINDSGLFIAMWAELGYLGVLYFILLIYFQYKKSNVNLIFFIILSLTKVHLFTPVFILYFVVSLSKKRVIKVKSNILEKKLIYAPPKINTNLH